MGRLTVLETGVRAEPVAGSAHALRVLILESDARTALSLRGTLEGLGIDVCGVASDEAEALSLARDTKPDLTLIDSDFSGPCDGGMETARRLHACQGIRSVFLASHSDPQALTRITASYPLGVVHRPYSAPQLKAALDLAAGRLRGRLPPAARSRVNA